MQAGGPTGLSSAAALAGLLRQLAQGHGPPAPHQQPTALRSPSSPSSQPLSPSLIRPSAVSSSQALNGSSNALAESASPVLAHKADVTGRSGQNGWPAPAKGMPQLHSLSTSVAGSAVGSTDKSAPCSMSHDMARRQPPQGSSLGPCSPGPRPGALQPTLCTPQHVEAITSSTGAATPVTPQPLYPADTASPMPNHPPFEPHGSLVAAAKPAAKSAAGSRDSASGAEWSQSGDAPFGPPVHLLRGRSAIPHAAQSTMGFQWAGGPARSSLSNAPHAVCAHCFCPGTGPMHYKL